MRRVLGGIACWMGGLLLVVGCAGGPESAASAQQKPLPKGDRLLGIAVGEAEDKDYDKAFALAKSVGLQCLTLSFNWTDIEKEPGEYKNDYLTIANGYYPLHKVKVDLILRPINTNRKEFPVDLANRRMDDPLVIERFKKMLDYVFAEIPDLELNSLAIGNEVDGYLGTDSRRWSQYKTFYNAVKDYAKAKRPGLRVGVTAMFEGLTGAAREFLQSLNETSDVIMVSYYPLLRDFTVKDPAVIGPDFDRLATLYPGRPIIVTEAGYPSSPACGSSEAKQAAFVRQVFRAWDAHADQIQTLHFSWLTDLAPTSVESFSRYYGVLSKAFKEFLRTLGLRTREGAGTDKEAFRALKEEAKARGWGG